MKRALSLFTFFSVSSFVLASVGYYILKIALPDGWTVFGVLYRMFLYHIAHPYQYIAVIAVSYGLVATPVALRWGTLMGWRLHGTIVGIIIVSIILASIPGGLLWKIHDMQAGWFPRPAQMRSDLIWGATTGLKIGWFVIAVSIPYNVLGMMVGYAVTRRGFVMAARTKSEAT